MRRIILVFVLLALPFVCFAETIVLKSGKTMEGKIIEQTDEHIKIDFQGIGLTYYLKDVDHIEKGNLSGAQASLPQQSPISALTEKPQILHGTTCILYLPSGIDMSNKKYPLVIGLSPSADANSIIEVWRGIADKHKWIIVASKENRNGIPYEQIMPKLAQLIQFILMNYPVDETKVIASGLSGGGMCSHALSFLYPKLIRAVVCNTGMIDEYFWEQRKALYPGNKLAVFLASPTDFRYGEMQRDKRFLQGLGWQTKWIEFEGGHTFAPASAYEEAVQWLEERFR